MKSKRWPRDPLIPRPSVKLWKIALAVSLLASLAVGGPAGAAADPKTLSTVQPESVRSIDIKAKLRPADLSQGALAGSAVKRLVKWPGPEKAEASALALAQGEVKAGASPIWIG